MDIDPPRRHDVPMPVDVIKRNPSRFPLETFQTFLRKTIHGILDQDKNRVARLHRDPCPFDAQFPEIWNGLHCEIKSVAKPLTSERAYLETAHLRAAQIQATGAIEEPNSGAPRHVLLHF